MSIEQNRNNNPFKVPENYFDDLSYKIQEKVQISESFDLKDNKYFNYKAVLSYSFIFIFFVISSYLAFNYVTKANKNQYLTNTEINELFEQGYIILNPYELSELYVDEVGDYEITEIEDIESLENYLTSDDIKDISLINEIE